MNACLPSRIPSRFSYKQLFISMSACVMQWLIRGKGSGWGAGVASHTPLKGLKTYNFFRSRTFHVLSNLKLKFDARYQSIPSKFEWLHKYVWYVYCSVCSVLNVTSSYCELLYGLHAQKNICIVYCARPNKSMHLP